MRQKRHKDTVGRWAKTKLDALDKYLKFYCTALSKQPFKRIYIDAFAGECVSRLRSNNSSSEFGLFKLDATDAEEQEQFILGSPMRALSIHNGFHQHYFFDLDKHRTSRLEDVAKDRTDVIIRVGDCNPMICELVPVLRQRNVRGVAFLDPYGPHLEWRSLEALARTGTMEVVVNFPLAMAINRLIPIGGSIPENWRVQLTKCFGTDRWKEVAYESTPSLFGDDINTKASDASIRLLRLYMERLRVLFPYVSSPRLICNTRNNPLYYLIWAGPNKLGLKGAEAILGQGKKIQDWDRHRVRR